MAKTLVSITVAVENDSAKAVQDQFTDEAQLAQSGVNKAINLLSKMAGGGLSGVVYVSSNQGDGTKATGTFTCDQSAAAAGDTAVIAGVTFTVASTPSTEPSDGEVSAGTTDTEFGDNFVAAIAAHPKVNGLVDAANAAGTVTVTPKEPGMWGEGITTTAAGAGGFAAGQAFLAAAAPGTIQANHRAHKLGG